MLITRAFGYLALLACLMLLTACPGDKCVGYTYYFKIPVDIYPAQDTLQVGDTLWVSTRFSDLATDPVGNTVHFDGVFCFNLGIGEIVPTGASSPATIEDGDPYFRRIFLKGSQEGGCVAQASYENHEYFLKVAYIAKKSGIFYLKNGVFKTHQRGEDKCKTSAQSESYFNVQDNNMEYLLRKYNLEFELPTLQREGLIDNMYGFIVVD